MTFAEISTLLDKGFSPDQIMQLSGTAEPEDQKPEDQKPEDQKPEDQKPEEQKPEENEILKQFKDIVSGLTSEVQALKKTMQETNIRTESRDTSPTTGESAFDVLAAMVRPPIEERK